jgi:hypothetical protein
MDSLRRYKDTCILLKMTSATEWNIKTLLQFQYSAVLYSSTKDTEVRNEQDDAQLYKTRRRKNSSHCCISMMQCVPNKQVAGVNIHISLSGSRLFFKSAPRVLYSNGRLIRVTRGFTLPGADA